MPKPCSLSLARLVYPPVQEISYFVGDCAEVLRFLSVRPGSKAESPLCVFGVARGSEDQNWDLPECFLTLKPSEHLESRDLGELQVQDDDGGHWVFPTIVKRLLAGEIPDRIGAVWNGPEEDFGVRPLECDVYEEFMVRVVLDQQNRRVLLLHHLGSPHSRKPRTSGPGECVGPVNKGLQGLCLFAGGAWGNEAIRSRLPDEDTQSESIVTICRGPAVDSSPEELE